MTVLEAASSLVTRPVLRLLLADDPDALALHDGDVDRLRALAQDCAVRDPAGAYEVSGHAALAAITTCQQAVRRLADRIEPGQAGIFQVLVEELERLRRRYRQKLGLDDV